MFWGISPYLRWSLSQNYPVDNSVLWSQWGIALNHAPFLIALWRRLLSWSPASFFFLASSAISTCFHPLLAITIDLCTQALWTTLLRVVLPSREPDSYHMSALEVFYTLWCTWLYLTENILLSYILLLVLENRAILPSFSFFWVYEYGVLFSSFYYYYLDYEHEVIYITYRVFISRLSCRPMIEHVLYYIYNYIIIKHIARR